MLQNYLLTAFRHLWRHRVFSFLNIAGLAIGFSACFLIFLYVRFEMSYDGFHSKKDRIYRLVCDFRTATDVNQTGLTSPPMAIAAKAEFPEIEAVVRLDPTGTLVRRGETPFQEDGAVYADSDFFNAFDFPLLEGDPGSALKAPSSVVLSQKTAKKYFGISDPLGQHLILGNDGLIATVTGVMKDMPENTQLYADLLISESTNRRLDPNRDRQWGRIGVFSYVLLKPHADPRVLEKKFPAFVEAKDGPEMKEQQMYFALFLEPLKDVYLHSSRMAMAHGSLTNLYIFSLIGIFILLIAGINFVNLATARSLERAREVGIRKVAGAGRLQLTLQFLQESVMLSLIAAGIAVLICGMLLPGFNTLAGKTVSHGLSEHPGNLWMLLAVAISVGLLAGIYPALALSRFRPIKVLTGRFSSSTRGLTLRRSLVVLQFTISIGIIVCTLVVYLQLHFMRRQYLGFDNQQTLVMALHGDPHARVLKNELRRVPGVLSTTASSTIPGAGDAMLLTNIQNRRGEMQTASLEVYFVDADFMRQYAMPIIAGRGFSPDFATDTAKGMILNESAVRLLGYSSPQQAIGARFSQGGREGRIVGVVKDFHTASLHWHINPLCIDLMTDQEGFTVSAKVRTADLPHTIAGIEAIWKKVLPGHPFSYDFADEEFNQQYEPEEQFGKLFLNFAMLAILISCMGLLGLASYTTLRRTKEIGIRKVLGASAASIVRLLSGEFLILVLIALLIATPVCWYLMHGWLHDFYYRIRLSWWIFGLGGGLAMTIALLTVNFQTIRAALANPATVLKTE